MGIFFMIFSEIPSPEPENKTEAKNRSHCVSRMIAKLRGHRLISKIENPPTLSGCLFECIEKNFGKAAHVSPPLSDFTQTANMFGVFSMWTVVRFREINFPKVLYPCANIRALASIVEEELHESHIQTRNQIVQGTQSRKDDPSQQNAQDNGHGGFDQSL